jgi:multiple sugar transport system substrate-binding protein
MDYAITNNWLYQAMVETAGGKMVSDDGKTVTFNSDAGRQALQYWVDLVNTDKSMPNLTRDQAEQSFLSGHLGMVVTSTARLRVFNKQNNFELRTAIFPTVNGKPRAIPAGGNNLIMLAQDPKKQAAAWDFIKYATSPEGTALFAQLTGYMVVRKSAYEKPELMGDYLKKEPNAKVTYDQVDDTVPWFNLPGSSGSKVFKIVQDNVVAALNKQKTVEQAVKDAAEQSNDILKSSK